MAIAASYARAVWGEKRGVRKIAILDFDVHHGNGTEDIVRSLVPSVEEHEISTPLFTGTVKAGRHREIDLGMLRSDSYSCLPYVMNVAPIFQIAISPG